MIFGILEFNKGKYVQHDYDMSVFIYLMATILYLLIYITYLMATAVTARCCCLNKCYVPCFEPDDHLAFIETDVNKVNLIC